MHDERDETGFPFRPWPALAAAVALGTALGPPLLRGALADAARDLAGDALAAGARVAALTLAAGWALAVGARPIRRPIRRPARRPARRRVHRPIHRPIHRAYVAWLGLIALAAALRALPVEPGRSVDAARAPPTGRFEPLATSVAGARDDERPARRWVEPQGERRVHGRLEPRALPDVRWTMTEGTLAAGERVVLLVDPRARPVDGALPGGPARGPVAPPRAQPPRVALAPDEVVRVARGPGGPLAWLARRLDALRTAGLERARALAHPTTRGLAAALLYGDRSELGSETSDLFVRTGTQHLLAVSGLHVALVAWLVLGPLAALGRRIAVGRSRGHGARRPAAGLAIGLLQALVVGAYVPLAGARPPVVRAALCCALAALALGVRRPIAASQRTRAAPATARRAFLRPDALSLWSLALVLECLGDPRAPGDLSVQLSYGATLGLVIGFSPLRRALVHFAGKPRIAELDRRGRARGAWWRVPLVRFADLALTGVAVSCVAMLATLPFTWAAFGEISPWSAVLTPLLVPLVAAFLATGFALAPWPELAAPVLDALTRAIMALLEAADRLPETPFALPARPTALVAAATALTFAALAAKHGQRATGTRDELGGDGGGDTRGDDAHGAATRVTELAGGARAARLTDVVARIAPRGAAALWAVVLVPWAAAPRGLELWALDVGGGTAVALRAPGAGTWIFDAGSRDRAGVARAALAPLLATWEPSRVGVVLSHGHADHHTALAWLAERRRVWLWAGALPAHLDERLPHAVPRLDIGRGGVSIDLGTREPRGRGGSGGLELRLLRGAPGGGNEGSRALALTYLGRHVLLTGDHEAEGLAALIEDGHADRPLELLLLPHHGSESELLGPLLAAARPREAWISSGHAPPVARELDRRGLRWRWTARDGPLGLEIAPGDPGDLPTAPRVVVRRLGGALGAPGGLAGAPPASLEISPGTDRAQRRGSTGPGLIPPGSPARPLSSPQPGDPLR